MSGINVSIDYASLFDTSSSSSSSLLNTIYGDGTTTNSPSAALAALQNAETNETKDVAAEAKTSAVARDIATFTSAVTNATSVQSLLSNPTVLKVLLTANGLADQIPYTALAKKALMSDTSDSSSLANKLSNTSWASAAKAYNFYSNGLSNIQTPATIASITNAYAETVWRNSLDSTTPGLANALTFRSSASAITNVDQVLGNSVLRDVVTTVLGLPLEIALQPLEAQEKAITTRQDLTKFKSQKYVDQYIQQYLVAKATAATSTTTSTNPLSTITSLTA
jgi:hypothetical protein